MTSFQSTVAGIVVGGLITWGVSYVYYVEAGKELARETDQLKRLGNATQILLKNLRDNDRASIDIAKDKDGLYTIVIVNANGKGSTATTEAPTATVTVK